MFIDYSMLQRYKLKYHYFYSCRIIQTWQIKNWTPSPSPKLGSLKLYWQRWHLHKRSELILLLKMLVLVAKKSSFKVHNLVKGFNFLFHIFFPKNSHQLYTNFMVSKQNIHLVFTFYFSIMSQMPSVKIRKYYHKSKLCLHNNWVV